MTIYTALLKAGEIVKHCETLDMDKICDTKMQEMVYEYLLKVIEQSLELLKPKDITK